MHQAPQRHEIEFRVQEPGRLMGLKIHKGGVKLANSLRVVECGGLHEVEANINFLVHLKERLELP
jgi:hypothetical protein